MEFRYAVVTVNHMPTLDEALHAGRGLIARGDVPDRQLREALRSATIVSLFPGLYCRATQKKDLRIRARALGRYDPSAVMVGRAAAGLTWWKELNVGVIQAARTPGCRPVPGFEWKRQAIPEAHVRREDGFMTTDAALTVLDLIPTLGGKAIDEAFRHRAVTLDELKAALAATPSPGNDLRRRLLHDSIDRPWSESERGMQSIVRTLALPWSHETNHRVASGMSRAYLDVAFPDLKLGFEVDGHPFHSEPDDFYRDRVRDLELSMAGWAVHRIPSDLVGMDPAFLARAVRAIVERRAAGLPGVPKLLPSRRDTP